MPNKFKNLLNKFSADMSYSEYLVDLLSKNMNEVEIRNACISEIKSWGINSPDANNNRPINFAVKSGNLEVVELLMKEGADINLRDNSGNTALHLAASMGQNDLCQYLIKAGAHLSILNGEGKTPEKCYQWQLPIGLVVLENAITKRKSDDAILSLNELNFTKEELNRPIDLQGNTLLHVAAANGLSDVCQYLIKGGADKSLLNAKGKTPEKCYQGQLPLKLGMLNNLITEGKADPALEFLSDSKLTKEELNKAVDLQGNTLLHIAASKGLIDVCKSLVKAGADLTALNAKDKTPEKCYQGQLPVKVGMLNNAIAEGRANPAIQILSDSMLTKEELNKPVDLQGNTLLNIAKTKGLTDVCQSLINAGADPSLKIQESKIPEKSEQNKKKLKFSNSCESRAKAKLTETKTLAERVKKGGTRGAGRFVR